MPTYQLSDTTFDATGIVSVRESWIEVDGKRQRSGQPELNADGLPLFEVGTTRPAKEWDRVVKKLAPVVVPSATKPQMKRHKRLKFKDLQRG